MHGLILQGGGSRGAYQAGVILALSEILPQRESPFTSISGVSVGAINASILAMEANNFRKGALRLKNYWMHLGHQDVYDIGKYGIFSAWKKLLSNQGHDAAFFENAPLTQFLDPKLDWQAIHNHSQRLFSPRYLNIHAYNYTTAQNEIFTNFDRSAIKYSRYTKFNVEHIIASTSLPYIFPGKIIGEHAFGDGGFKLDEPASAQIRQGCHKIMAISLDDGSDEKTSIIEHLFEAIFPDAVESDFCKINQINKSLPRYGFMNRSRYRKVETLLLRPSEENFPNKEKLIDTLPKSLAYFAKALGIQDNPDSNILNYIVFSPEYTDYLIKQGYDDAMQQKETIVHFFAS
tara:strand:- start:20220 stop:21257 length:1038 start_codon:yes stop_codon:yes gene_type:complete